MIIKLLIIIYSWVWNVQTWQPASKEDWSAVIYLSAILDPLAIFGLIFAVIGIIRLIHERSAE